MKITHINIQAITHSLESCFNYYASSFLYETFYRFWVYIVLFFIDQFVHQLTMLFLTRLRIECVPLLTENCISNKCKLKIYKIINIVLWLNRFGLCTVRLISCIYCFQFILYIILYQNRKIELTSVPALHRVIKFPPLFTILEGTKI